jgi:superfamily II DNA helicase RecQ
MILFINGDKSLLFFLLVLYEINGIFIVIVSLISLRTDLVWRYWELSISYRV